MSFVTKIDDILMPWLNQVIGSTPESVAEAIKGADLEGKSDAGLQLACIAIMGATVNKPTMEKFANEDAVSLGRPALRNALAVSGKANMTAITLLGHCLLTTRAFDGVKFVQELRHKMGVDNLWAGELKADSLSEKQKKIYEEKKRKTNEASAKALGGGYLKWTGLSSDNWTHEEMSLWKIKPKPMGFEEFKQAEEEAKKSKEAAAPNSGAKGKRDESPLTDAQILDRIPDSILVYARDMGGFNVNDIIAAIRKSSVEAFVSKWESMRTKDPDGARMRAARTAVGT